MSYKHGLDHNSWDAFLVQELICSLFFQLIKFCEVFLGFLQTVICSLPKTGLKFLLCICFPTSLLNTASSGGWWGEPEAEHGTMSSTHPSRPFSTRELPYPGHCPLPTLWWPQDPTNPLGVLPAMAAFREIFVILFAFFLDILGFLFTCSCAWVLLFFFSRPDFLLFLFPSCFSMW